MFNKKKLKNIKLFLVDVDGVLTDGGIYYFDNGIRGRRYHMHDGHFGALQRENVIVSGFCTGESDKNIANRAEKLGLRDYNIFGAEDKLAAAELLLKKNNWQFEQLAYVGDDLSDLPLLRKAGVAFSISNAITAVKQEVDYVSKKKGGEGAVREIIDIFIKGLKK